MGLLDDAIREHLELKKRNGADPNEIADQEREAFGPGRKAPEPLEVPGEAAAPVKAAAGAVPPEVVEPEEPLESEALPESEPEPEFEGAGEDISLEDAAAKA